MNVKEIYVQSTLDGTMQPSLFYQADLAEKRPLLVGLHSWSYDRTNQIKNMLPLAEKLGFHLLLPEFRGPNLISNPNHTLACGSIYAKTDIKDAMDYLIKQGIVDADNIFILGFSGGGQMALLMAGFCPEYFKAVGAYVPVTDLEKFSGQSEKYLPHLLACCSNSKEEMQKRSPMYYLDGIAKANVKIFHGKFDSVVSFTHSLDLFNAIHQKHPSARVYLDIFDGGHQVDMIAAEHWILSQYKKVEKITVTG